MALPASADVVVVGASTAGLLIARWLAEAGVDVAVLEAGPVGQAASGRGLGLVEHGVLEHPGRTVASLGQERAAALWGWAARSRQLLDALGLFEATGTVWASVFAGEAGDIERSVAALQGLGVSAEALEAAQVSRRTGGRFEQGGLALPGDGRVPLGHLHQLARLAEAAGVGVHSGAAVIALRDGVDGLEVVVGEERVAAEAVVLACGVGAASLHPALAGLMPVRDQGLRVEGQPASGSVTAGRAGQGWTCWRVDDDGVRVSGARWASPHLEVGERDASVIVPSIQSKLEGFARQRLGLDGPVVERWAWVFAQSPDGLPVVGPLPGDPRLVGCVGFGATPLGLEVAAARSVAEGLLEGEGEVEVPWMLSSRRIVRWRYGR